MKILHISTADVRGAGLCAYRIHKTLLEIGHDSKLLVMEKGHPDSDVTKAFGVRSFIYRVFHQLLRWLRIYVFEYDKLIRLSKATNCFYSRPVSPFDLSHSSLVKAADIIHLHWVDNYFDVPVFLKKVKKPIVWTLHDEGLFCGVAHYTNEVLPNHPLEIKYKAIKERMIINRGNTGIVFLSKYFFYNFSSYPAVRGCQLRVINNSVDCIKFHPCDKNTARQRLGISADTILFSFVAAKIDDPRKGLMKLIRALEIINNPKMKILAVGNNQSFEGHRLVQDVGSVNDTERMSLLLSSTDYYVMPSMKEAFAQSPIEAMACGVPAIVTPVSGTEELMNDKCGVRCDGFEISDIVNAIKKAMQTNYNREEIILYVKQNYSPEIICKQYIDFYQSLVNASV